MADNNKYIDRMVFGLDIGTRSIVGSVGYMEKNKFNVVAHYVKEHETRDMLDGQIHDIGKVSDSIIKVKTELEEQLGFKLKDVCIAAAGRVLKTITVHKEYELPEEAVITGENIYSLELMGVEDAYEKINTKQDKMRFYCVGYTVIKYYLNDYVIANLEGHKANKISADILATFLPEDVVDGLYAAVEGAGLQVANLTLEPIAAINVAIPAEYRLLNIALVDVGAGTSDISITRDGSIVAYGMIPKAGDEFTEMLVSKYLVDFNTAEKIKRASVMNRQINFKDIMGLKKKVSPKEVREVYSQCVKDTAGEIADKIKELNGGKSVSAVFVVGGGGKVYGFTKAIAKKLGLPEERVALRGEEVLGSIEFKQENIKKDPLLVTPIGICLNFYNQNNNFIFIHINGERIKLYDNDRLTVVDAVMQIGFPNQSLFPRRGKELNYIVNGEHRMVRGSLGEPAVITVNDKEANINTPIKKNDRVTISESTEGAAAEYYIEQILEYKSSITINVNGKKVICPKLAEVDGEIKTGDYRIKNGDNIKILDYYTVDRLMTFMDIDCTGKQIYVNNMEVNGSEKIYENFSVNIIESVEIDVSQDEIEQEMETNTEESIQEEVKPQDLEEEVLPIETKAESKDINVIVNGTLVTLKGKDSYIFVDILDFYPFDTKVAGGNDLITKINGEKSEFTGPLKEGDTVEIYWED
ncbi:MAG: cell division protein FtsA [Lachnospiraceae bacterium]|nr:cell division protein FtsA [Lachnospiraceae bacterium]